MSDSSIDYGDVYCFKPDGTLPSDAELKTVLDEIAKIRGLKQGSLYECIEELRAEETDFDQEDVQLDNETGAGRTIKYAAHMGDRIEIDEYDNDIHIEIPTEEFRSVFMEAGLVLGSKDMMDDNM